MSIKLQKYRSNEGGPFGKTFRKNASFDLPAASAGFTDLENSCLLVKMSAYCTANAGTSGGGGGTLIPVVFGERVNNIGPLSNGGASALVKNVSVMSKSNSSIANSQRDQNVINCNLDYFLKTRSEEKAMFQFNGGGDYNSGRDKGIQCSPFLSTSKPTDFTTEVTAISEHIETELRIPFKHIDAFARTIRQFPNSLVGDLVFKVEWETFKDVITNANPLPVLGVSDLAATGGGGAQWGDAANPLKWTAREADTNFKISDLDQSPFYIGCPLIITLTDSASGADDSYSTISSLKVNGNYLEILLTTPIPPSSGAATATAVSLKQDIANDATFTWVINEASLEMAQLQLTPSQYEKSLEMTRNAGMPWYDYRLIKETMAAANYFSKEIYIEPMCLGLVILTPQNKRLISSLDTAIDYRFSIDGNAVDDRDIPVGLLTSNTGIGVARQMHNHKLVQFYKNMGLTLKRFDLPRLDYDSGGTEQNHHIYPLILPLVNKTQRVNITINASGNMTSKDVYILPIYQRLLKFKNGKPV